MAKDGGTTTKSTNGKTSGKQNGKNDGLMSGLKRASKGKAKKGKDLEDSDEDVQKYVLQSSGPCPFHTLTIDILLT